MLTTHSDHLRGGCSPPRHLMNGMAVEQLTGALLLIKDEGILSFVQGGLYIVFDKDLYIIHEHTKSDSGIWQISIKDMQCLRVIHISGICYQGELFEGEQTMVSPFTNHSINHM